MHGKQRDGNQGQTPFSVIVEQRKRLEWHLEDNPGLKSKLPEAIGRAYDLAKSGAEKETGIPSSTFPEQCPWSFEQFVDADFWPDVADGGK
ncbi:MAG: DUF29 domain-containing protein [Gammaproteobacteria bacterium]|nr:DUF29 domain-containing protein [Gammaproteobacteria bacterium]MBU1722366.1 DUF29 domain-containing protein [Gammaproteobacteria bacterium]MBU2004697.1 DUF29 domain-containing protein [Gammaproteobacteria bacterium]